MGDYHATENVLIASADCSTQSRQPGSGAALCNHYGVQSYPTLAYGDPDSVQHYSGSRDHSSLLSFAKSHLGPIDPTPTPTPPAPTPVPPTPTPVPPPTPVPTPPAPTPAPTPGSAHYGQSPCMSDEKRVHLDADGSAAYACAASCENKDCPTDLPAGVTAWPGCYLWDHSDYVHRCALSCNRDSDCDEANGAYCGRANFCVYREQDVCPKDPAVTVAEEPKVSV